MDSPVHAHSSSAWFDRYALEIRMFLSGAESLVDAGCGSGEILERIAGDFPKVTAIDYSPSMLERARARMESRGYAHVRLFCDNITAIAKYCDEPVDAIYSSAVVQYLSPTELDQFLVSCARILKPGGRVVLLNIPNINCRTLFLLGFYKHERPVPFFRFLKGLPGLWMKMVRYWISNGFRKYDDGIGNWFSIDEIRKRAVTHSFNAEIYGASAVEYHYRFHAVLTLDSSV